MKRRFFSSYSVVLPWCYLALGGFAQAKVDPPAVLDAAAVSAEVHPALLTRLDKAEGPVKTWVFFKDKGIRSAEEYERAISKVAAMYNPRAVQRRMLRGLSAARGEPVFNEHDLPVVQAYIDAVESTGAHVHVISCWVNAVSVYANREQVRPVAGLPSVA